VIAPADLSSAARLFLDATGEFLGNLSQVAWLPFTGALLLLLAMQLARARAWQNVLRAAYPGGGVPFVPVAGAFLVGVGVNAVLPARAGDAVKVVLAKQAIRGSTYPTVTSSFAVQTVFDTTAGLLVFTYALTQGILPTPPQMPRLAALDYTFWTTNSEFLVPTVMIVVALAALGITVAARRVQGFWARVRQGVVILLTPLRYLRQVASWQAAGWVCRFGAFWLFLEAFGIGGSVGNVMLVMSAQAVAGIVPLTPGGAGAQQAILVATLEGPSRIAVLSFSAGTQLAMAAWGAVIGFAALFLVFGTSDWRGLLRHAERESEREREGEDEGHSPKGASGVIADPPLRSRTELDQ